VGRTPTLRAGNRDKRRAPAAERAILGQGLGGLGEGAVRICGFVAEPTVDLLAKSPNVREPPTRLTGLFGGLS
jgi:hypothetical protein